MALTKSKIISLSVGAIGTIVLVGLLVNIMEKKAEKKMFSIESLN